jgi:hypothetical protein
MVHLTNGKWEHSKLYQYKAQNIEQEFRTLMQVLG